MALITLPPRSQETDPSNLINCCTPDSQARAALIVYLLALLLKKVGGTDWTDCDAILSQWANYQGTDRAQLELVELELLSALLTANGVTVNTADAQAQSQCLRNSLPPLALDTVQFVLWNLIVNELTP